MRDQAIRSPPTTAIVRWFLVLPIEPSVARCTRCDKDEMERQANARQESVCRYAGLEMSDEQTRPNRRNPWQRKDEPKQGPQRPPTEGGMDPRQRNITIAWVIGGLILFALTQTFTGGQSESIEFSRFLDLADEGQVTEVNISETSVSGRFDSDEGEQEFSTTLPVNYE